MAKFKVGEIAIIVCTDQSVIGSSYHNMECEILALNVAVARDVYRDYAVRMQGSNDEFGLDEYSLRKRRPPSNSKPVGAEKWDTFCDKIGWHAPRETIDA